MLLQRRLPDTSNTQMHWFVMVLYFVAYYLPAFLDTGLPRGNVTNGTQIPCKVPSLPNPTTRKGWPHHRGLRPLLFSNSDVGSFTCHKNKSVSVVRRDLRFFVLMREDLESLTICRCHCKGSTSFSVFLKTPSVGPAGV